MTKRFISLLACLLSLGLLLFADSSASASTHSGTWSCSTTDPSQACPINATPPDYQASNIYDSDGYNTYVEGQWWGGGGSNPVLLQANSASDMQETTTEPGTNLAVEGDPGVQQVLNDTSAGTLPLLSSYSTLQQRFTVKYTDSDFGTPANPLLSDETASDDFISDPNGPINEIMVWEDIYDVQPYESELVASPTIDGRHFQVWYGVGASAIVFIPVDSSGNEISQPRLTGVVHLAAIFGWLESNNEPATGGYTGAPYLSPATTLGMVDFINEPRGTGSQKMTWHLSSYSVPEVCKTGDEC